MKSNVLPIAEINGIILPDFYLLSNSGHAQILKKDGFFHYAMFTQAAGNSKSYTL